MNVLDSGVIVENMDKPLVSIIVNCFNSARYLRETLESIQAQTFSDWEVIFWDNQSTDASAAIFKGFFDPRFKYFFADVHTPLGHARNLAVEKANGKWLAFVDCDDVWAARKLELQLAQVQGDSSDVGLLYGKVQFKVENISVPKGNSLAAFYSRFKIDPHGALDIYPRLLLNNSVIFSTVLVLKSLFVSVGGINPELKQNEDYDLLLKVCMKTRAICIPDVCAVYRVHQGNISHSQAGLSYLEFVEIYKALPDTPLVQDAMVKNYSRFALYKVSQGQWFDALLMLLTRGSVVWVCARVLQRLGAAVGRLSGK
jgi:glycosyltransferase involved in cell wall biosynthesis